MANPLTFVQPRIGLRREKTWTLDDTKLAWATSAETGETPLGNVTGIKVRFTPSVQAGVPATRECLIAIKGQKQQAVVTQDYNLASDAAVREAYAAFVRDLMGRTTAQNPSVVLSSGSALIRIMWIVMFIAIAAAALFFAYHLVTGDFDYRIALVVAIFVSVLYPVWRQIQVSNETTFDVANIPAEILG